MSPEPSNGVLYRAVVLAFLGVILVLGALTLADRVYVRQALADFSEKQAVRNQSQAFTSVLAALPDSKREMLLDLAVQQLNPQLRREVAQRVTIPGVPDVSPRNYGGPAR